MTIAYYMDFQLHKVAAIRGLFPGHRKKKPLGGRCSPQGERTTQINIFCLRPLSQKNMHNLRKLVRQRNKIFQSIFTGYFFFLHSIIEKTKAVPSKSIQTYTLIEN